jgi:hypothetical protein
MGPPLTGDKTMHVLTIEFSDIPGERHEIHVLNPGECMEGFGGSSRGLVVGKTASLITRRTGKWGQHDIEHDIFAENIWEWIAQLMNLCDGTVKATSVIQKEKNK